jgi:hypothetical protein
LNPFFNQHLPNITEMKKSPVLEIVEKNENCLLLFVEIPSCRRDRQIVGLFPPWRRHQRQRPYRRNPGQSVRFVLPKFGGLCVDVLPNIVAFLARCEAVMDDEVRDRATY